MKLTMLALFCFVLCVSMKVPHTIAIVAQKEQCGDEWTKQFDLDGDIVRGDRVLWEWLSIPKMTALDAKHIGEGDENKEGLRAVFSLESFPPITPCAFFKHGSLKVRRNVFAIVINQQVFYQKEWFGGVLTKALWVNGTFRALFRNYDGTMQWETLYAIR